MSFVEDLKKVLGEGNVIENEDLSKHTTLRIGGPARYYVCVNNEDSLLNVIELINKDRIRYYILGNGSNVLVSDNGFDGVIIKLTGEFNQITVDGLEIIAGAGAMLSNVSKKALDSSLTGLEFASGIPGTLGGALVMNAGAYGGEMKQVVREVVLLEKVIGTEAGKSSDSNVTFVKKTYSLDEMNFSYRHSIAKEKEVIFLSARLGLANGDPVSIKASMDEMNASRREKQPLEYPSAGSTFKRPEGHFAGKLISDAGLKGYRVGDAMVSEKHAGFCVNIGTASEKEFSQLMKEVSDKVYELYEVRLEPEVIFLD